MRQERQRQRRAASLVKEIVSNIIRTEVQDDDIGFLTITDVEVSVDMRNANVYFSVLGTDEEVEQTAQALHRARKFINMELGERIEMRYTPQLRFVHDDTPARAQRIEEILDRVDTSLPDEDDDEQQQ